MITTATSQLENNLMAQAMQQVGRRPGSVEMGGLLIQMIGERARAGDSTRMLPLLMRLALKLNPYAPYTQALISDHATVMQAWARRMMPDLMQTIESCRMLKVPVPVIVSCSKYMPKARCAQAEVRDRYFGLTPIIVRGDGETIQESTIGSELCLPVDDSYEALPAKIFEMMVLFHALGADCGVLKLDDDLQLVPMEPLSLPNIQATFATADYIGLALASPHHDRCWHYGKCASPVPMSYGKPFRGAWARGALYYLSGRALQALAHNHLLFPGCIDGELYEDKAVGDTLREAGITLINHPLEPRLGISTEAPERTLVAAE